METDVDVPRLRAPVARERLFTAGFAAGMAVLGVVTTVWFRPADQPGGLTIVAELMMAAGLVSALLALRVPRIDRYDGPSLHELPRDERRAVRSAVRRGEWPREEHRPRALAWLTLHLRRPLAPAAALFLGGWYLLLWAEPDHFAVPVVTAVLFLAAAVALHLRHRALLRGAERLVG